MRAIFLFLQLITLPLFAVTAECMEHLQKELINIQSIQLREYKKIDPNNGAIRPGNFPLFLPGTSNQAAIVIHGFVASPFEVETLGRVLNKLGVTVYMPLLPGFGASAKVANHYGSREWKSALNTYLNVFSTCFSEVTLSGFSTGGSLVTNFLLNQPNVERDGLYDNKIKITKAVLISPYLESDSEFFNILDFTFSIFVNSVSIKTMYFLSHHPDFKGIIINQRYYNSDFPLLAAKQVIELGREIRERANTTSKVPIFVAYSLADKTIATYHIETFYHAHFLTTNFSVYENKFHIPHQLLVPNINPNYHNLVKRMVDFLLSDKT